MGYSLSFQDVYAYFVVFTRIAPMMVVLPIFSDVHIPQRIRLMIALALTLVITQVLSPSFPNVNPESSDFFLLLGKEALIGYCIGLVAKIWMMSLQVVANIISMETSLSNATIFNPSLATQDTVLSSLLMLSAVTFLVLTDMHHRFIEAILYSYHNFPLGSAFVFEDFSEVFVSLINNSFMLAVRLSMPFLIMGLVFHMSLGFLNRLMPQLQVFFIAMPAQILAGLALVGLTIGVILQNFNNTFDTLIFYARP